MSSVALPKDSDYTTGTGSKDAVKACISHIKQVLVARDAYFNTVNSAKKYRAVDIDTWLKQTTIDIHEYEVLIGHVSPYIDIDCKDMSINPTELLNSIIWTFADKLSEVGIKINGTGIACASRSDKISYHVVFTCSHLFFNAPALKLFINEKVISAVEEKYRKYVDTIPYGHDNCFRFVNQSKWTEKATTLNVIKDDAMNVPGGFLTHISNFLIGRYKEDERIILSEPIKIVHTPKLDSYIKVESTDPIFTTVCLENIGLILDNLSVSRWDNYDCWLKIGMILRNINCQIEVWENFSKKSDKYRDGDCRKKWFSFSKKDISIGTIIAWLKEDSIDTFNVLIELTKDFTRKKSEDDEANDAKYIKLKAEWEINHFYLRATNSIVEELDCKLEYFSIEHAKSGFGSEHKAKFNEHFLKKWMLDDTHRAYIGLSFAPSSSSKYYSLYKGMLYEKINVSHDEGVLKAFNDLLDSVTNKHTANRNFVLNWLAHLIQKPFENPGTALIFTGQNGTGKDTLGQFIGDFIIGDSLYINYTSAETFWDKHNTDREFKLLIKLEEACSSSNIKYAASLKSRITASKETFNPKGIKPYTIDVFARYIMTSNEATPVLFEGQGDRRFFLCPCGTYTRGKHDFWNFIYKTLMNFESGAIIGNYLANIDISEFNPREALRTEFAKIAIEESKSSEVRFVESDAWDGHEIDSSSLYELYTHFCNMNHLIAAKSTKSFGMKLMELVRDGVISKGRNSNNSTYIKF